MNIKEISDLLEWLKKSDQDYKDYEKKKAPELVKWRKLLILFYVIWAILITTDLLWAGNYTFKNIWALLIVGITIVDSILLFISALKYLKYNKQYLESESRDAKLATKYYTLVDELFHRIKNKYGNQSEKAVSFLLNDLINKRTEIINEYEKKAASFGSATMVVITAFLSFFVKVFFESNSNDNVFFVILAIFLLVVFVKILNFVIRSFIKQPAWGKAYKESYLIDILNDVKYIILESNGKESEQEQ